MSDVTHDEVEMLDVADEVADGYEDDGDDELELDKLADFPVSGN